MQISLCRVLSLTPTAQSHWLRDIAGQVNIQNQMSPLLLV